MIAITSVARSFRSDLNLCSGRRGGDGRSGSWRWRRRGVRGRYPLEFSKTYGLRHAVFGECEIVRGQAFDGLAAFVFHRDFFDDQLRGDANGSERGSLGLRALHRALRPRRGGRRARLRLLSRGRSQDAKRRDAQRNSDSAHDQNLTRNVICNLRMVFAVFGKPKSGLVTVVFHDVNVTLLSTFVAFIDQSAFSRLPMRNVRSRDAFSVNTAGPLIESRPASPHSPAVGALYAAGFRKNPAGAAVIEAPVRLGRIVPVTPVPATFVRYTGVSGKPLPAVSCVATVHSLKNFPRQPVSSA